MCSEVEQVGYETWLRQQQHVEEAMAELASNGESVPKPGRTQSSWKEGRQLQEALFAAVAAMQQHEAEHGCQKAAERGNNPTRR